LFSSTLIFLAFLVSLSVLKQDPFLILFPKVTVVSIQMALIKTKLRHQHWISSQLIEIIQYTNWIITDHKKQIQIIRIMAQLYLSFFGITKIILPFLKGVPHHPITFGGPIKRS